MPGDVTATATISAGNIGIRKPRITRARKRLLGRKKWYENIASPRVRVTVRRARLSQNFRVITSRHR
jgi:hypothetical protein